MYWVTAIKLQPFKSKRVKTNLNITSLIQCEKHLFIYFFQTRLEKCAILIEEKLMFMRQLSAMQKKQFHIGCKSLLLWKKKAAIL